MQLEKAHKSYVVGSKVFFLGGGLGFRVWGGVRQDVQGCTAWLEAEREGELWCSLGLGLRVEHPIT